MVNFDGLVAAVQRSVLEASAALAKRNVELFNSYFEVVEDEAASEVSEAASRALAAARAVREAGAPEAVEDALREATQALESAAAALSAPRRSSTTLRPKTTAIQYPCVTKDGPSVHTVHVPLISLAPVSFARITELRFKTELDLSIQGEAITAGFPPEGRAGGAADSPAGTPSGGRPASVEIVLGDEPTSQGLRLIIEGYDRALRAQIPG